MSSNEQNQTDSQIPDNIKNSDISAQNLSSTGNKEKKDFFQQDTNSNLFNQSQSVEVKQNENITNNNTSQNQNSFDQSYDSNKGNKIGQNPTVNNAVFNNSNFINNSISTGNNRVHHSNTIQFNKSSIITNIFTLLSFAFLIAIIALLARVYHFTKHDPLENLRLINDIPDTSVGSTQEVIAPTYIGEKIFIDDKDRILLRYLGDDCSDYQAELAANNYELDKVFKLKFKKVHRMALGLIIVNVLHMALLLLIIILSLGAICCGECCLAPIAILSCLFIIVALTAGIVSLILFIIMMVNYYKGNTTGEFLDFYEDCLDEKNRNYLESAYDKLNKLNKHFIALIVIYFASMFINIAYNLYSQFKKKKV